MKGIKAIATLKIHPGKTEKFKEIAAKCIESVKSKDTDTWQYDWFINDSSECIVMEHYKDSESALKHSANLGDLLGQLLGISSLSLNIFGDASPELKKALEGLDISYYKFEGGL